MNWAQEKILHLKSKREFIKVYLQICFHQCSTELGRFANSSEECSDIFWGTEVLLCLGESRTNKGTLRIHANLHFLKIFSGTNLVFLNYQVIFHFGFFKQLSKKFFKMNFFPCNFFQSKFIYFTEKRNNFVGTSLRRFSNLLI